MDPQDLEDLNNDCPLSTSMTVDSHHPLSVIIIVYDNYPIPISIIRLLNQTHSIASVKVALYSALQLKETTIGFFLLSQEIRISPLQK